MPVDGTDAKVGDAIVLYPAHTSGTSGLEDDGDHVGLVTAVNSDGTINTVNGDFTGAGNGHVQVVAIDNETPANFASSSEKAKEEWLFVSPGLATTSATTSLPGVPALYDPASGNFEVYATGTGGALEEDAWNADTGWTGLKSRGGSITAP